VAGLILILQRACWLPLAALLVGCATSPTGRQQFMLVPPGSAITMAESAYMDTLRHFASKGKLLNNPALANRVALITGRLVTVAIQEYPHTAHWKWSVALLDEPSANAWAMAGGRMAIHRGIMESLRLSDDEIAHIMGHEIAHSIANHHAERMSMVLAQNLAVSVMEENVGGSAGLITDAVASVALTLPNSRTSEEEADKIGLRLATMAGYDPRAAVTLWNKMLAQEKTKPLEFLSTHPNSAERAIILASLVGEVQALRPSVPPQPHRLKIYAAR